MANEIINRVANSKLVTIDLEDYYPPGERVVLDISDWLYEGVVLREKDFRRYVKEHNWTQYRDAYVALTCSGDAIIPGWAYMLISTQLSPFTARVVIGDLESLESFLYREVIEDLDLKVYKDKPVIIKGCTNKPVPKNAYVFLTERLIPVAKSIMYGEACSSVPLYKRK
jgi:hypothetical protein